MYNGQQPGVGGWAQPAQGGTEQGKTPFTKTLPLDPMSPLNSNLQTHLMNPQHGEKEQDTWMCCTSFSSFLIQSLVKIWARDLGRPFLAGSSRADPALGVVQRAQNGIFAPFCRSGEGVIARCSQWKAECPNALIGYLETFTYSED